MKIRILLLLASCLFFSTSYTQPPVTKKIPKTFTEHGVTRTDDYFWLSNPKDTVVIDHLKKENAYVEAMMKHTEPLQKTIYDELISRIEQKYVSLPVQRNSYWYYIRYEEGKQYPLYCRKKENLNAVEEIFLDANALAKGHQIFIVRGYAVSRDNSTLVYGIDTTGDRRCFAYLKKLNGSEPAQEILINTSGDYEWANDNVTLFYVINDHTVRAYQVKKHALGADAKTDAVVYTEKDSTFSVGLNTSRKNELIYISSGSTLSSECRYINASHPEQTPVLIQPRTPDMLYYITGYEDSVFYITTNSGAKNFKLVKTPVTNSAMSAWKDIIPHNQNALLQQAAVFTKYIVAQQKINALTQILVINRDSQSSYYIDFGEQAYVASLSNATDAYDTDSIRYTYTSLTQPETDYKFDLRTKEKSLLKKAEVGGGYDGSLYETKRLWAPARDGIKVSLTIVYKKTALKRSGINPMLLYAYGSYGNSTDPYFNRSVISLLDRGFVYGIAHIRGGQELGRAWYEDGKLLKKKNTFNDFIDCAQFLVNEHFTSPDKLFINGGSAGGMLIGAVTNMRPDLFRGVLAEVPWTDVITDMFNPDLPLTTLEYDEWGDPNKKEYYDYMLSWSPYDNVVDAVYPAIFSTGGLNDTQVPYFSPAKWVAKVREHNKGKNPILFKCNMGAGHGGESGRFERQKLTALKYAFMLDLLDQKK